MQKTEAIDLSTQPGFGELLVTFRRLGSVERLMRFNEQSRSVIADALRTLAKHARKGGDNRLANSAARLSQLIEGPQTGPLGWIHSKRLATAFSSFVNAVDATANGIDLPAEPRDFTVVLVDDEAIEVDIVSRALGPSAKVMLATDPDQAKAILGENRPDLILLDINLGPRSGTDLLADLQSDPELAEVPMVMRSSRDDETALVRGLAGGAIDYISKNVPTEQMARRCMDIMKNGRSRLHGQIPLVGA